MKDVPPIEHRDSPLPAALFRAEPEDEAERHRLLIRMQVGGGRPIVERMIRVGGSAIRRQHKLVGPLPRRGGGGAGASAPGADQAVRSSKYVYRAPTSTCDARRYCAYAAAFTTDDAERRLPARARRSPRRRGGAAGWPRHVAVEDVQARSIRIRHRVGRQSWLRRDRRDAGVERRGQLTASPSRRSRSRSTTATARA